MRKLIEKIKERAWIIVLAIALVSLGLGIFRGEAGDVFEKARIVCLECIGIG
jgi:hypothetical protein